MVKQRTDSHKVIVSNRRAKSQYAIVETLEGGLVLTGPEVKSLRAGKVNMQEGFVKIEDGQANLWNVHISPYSHGSSHVEQEPLRTRRVLMNRIEIDKWFNRVKTKGLTVVPLELYFKKGKVKVKLGLGKGKRGPDRREDIKRRTVTREIQRDYAGKHRIK